MRTLFALLLTVSLSAVADPLPSWNDGPTRQAITDFVTAVTTEAGPDYVPPAERIAVFDNEMLEWTTAGAGRRLGLILHHDDATREYAYDRDSHFGKLSKGLDDAASKGWVLVSMKTDWGQVFPEAGAEPKQD